MQPAILLCLLLLASSIVAAEPTPAPAGHAKPAAGDVRDVGVAKKGPKKPKLVIFDCKPPNSEDAAEPFRQVFDVQVVELPAGLTQEKAVTLVRDTLRNDPDKPRLASIFCHGEWDKKTFTFVRREEKKEHWRFDAGAIRKAIEEGMEGRENPMFLVNTCSSGAIASTFPKGQCLAKDGAVCAACPADCTTSAVVLSMGQAFAEAHEDCNEVDSDPADGKVTVKELKAWFAARTKQRLENQKKVDEERRDDEKLAARRKVDSLKKAAEMVENVSDVKLRAELAARMKAISEDDRKTTDGKLTANELAEKMSELERELFRDAYRKIFDLKATRSFRELRAATELLSRFEKKELDSDSLERAIASRFVETAKALRDAIAEKKDVDANLAAAEALTAYQYLFDVARAAEGHQGRKAVNKFLDFITADRYFGCPIFQSNSNDDAVIFYCPPGYAKGAGKTKP